MKLGVVFELWDNIDGMRLKNLFKDPRYPDSPDKTTTLKSFDTPLDRGDRYGARVTTYYLVIILKILITQMVIIKLIRMVTTTKMQVITDNKKYTRCEM